MVGILSYGTYVPKFRIKTADTASSWKKDEREIIGGLKVYEKSVPGVDEDAVTVAYEAAALCLACGKVAPGKIEAMFVGSESHPYAVNPTSTIVGEFLGIGRNYLASDLQFACKAGTTGLILLAALASSNRIGMGMTIGADTAQGKPHDMLEYTSACAGAAFAIGRGSKVGVKLLSSTSYSSDTPDFWRRDGIRYPSHAGRFTGEPAYFAHVVAAALRLLAQTRSKPSDYDFCVFHMPNGKFPREAAHRLGFSEDQLKSSLIVESIGNPYSASSLLGLAAVLDVARPGSKIFMVSYGSGAGSDGFVWETTEHIKKIQQWRRKQHAQLTDQIQDKTYVSYIEYLKKTHNI